MHAATGLTNASGKRQYVSLNDMFAASCIGAGEQLEEEEKKEEEEEKKEEEEDS